MKRNNVKLLSVLLMIILIVSGIFMMRNKNKDASELVVSSMTKDQTTIFENGDFIYSPSHEEIGYDSEAEIFFYENLLNLILSSEISNEQAKELANVVNGELVGQLQGSINMLQIQVEERSLEGLNQLADRFENNQLVKLAKPSTPSFISDLNDSEEQGNIEKIDQANPEGDNWWAEAISAYSAWYYLDNNEDEFEKVDVAVLETGKLGEEGENIDDAAIDKETVVVVNVAENAEYKRHAELVTKTIAADENSETIRGVAEPVAKIKFRSMGDITKDEIETISETEIIGQIKNSQDHEVKVINLSWGTSPMSKERWSKEENWFQQFFQNVDKQDEAYHRYLHAEQNSNNQVSANLILALDELLASDRNNQFLIIQSAGNGYSRAKNEDWDEQTASEVWRTGVFANINQDTYDLATAQGESKLQYELEDILSHIIVVGGAELSEDKTSYQSPAWASYGEAIDIAAPASGLYIDRTKEDEDDRKPVRGTSFAAPMVTGAAALVWSYNPDMAASDVKGLLINSAKDIVIESKGEKGSYPMLNMTAFLNEHPHYYSVIKTYLNEFPYYNELLETYRMAVSEKWGQNELDEKDLGPIHYEPQSLPDDYGYELRDIAGNGLPELILGVYREDGRSEIHEIYTLKNNKPVKIFENEIRKNINIYKDGTIKTSSSLRAGSVFQEIFYTLNDDGTVEMKTGYEEEKGVELRYKSLSNPEELLTDADVEKINEKYRPIDIINHSFTPFVINGGESAKQENESKLSDGELETIIKESYQKISTSLSEVYIGDLFEKYYDYDDGETIWNSEVNPNHPFYDEVYQLVYPAVSDYVAEKGMETIINEAFSLYWQPAAPPSFYEAPYDFEVIVKGNEFFKFKQTREIGPQDYGGDSYHENYLIDFVKEDGVWKFAGAEKQQ